MGAMRISLSLEFMPSQVAHMGSHVRKRSKYTVRRNRESFDDDQRICIIAFAYLQVKGGTYVLNRTILFSFPSGQSLRSTKPTVFYLVLK